MLFVKGFKHKIQKAMKKEENNLENKNDNLEEDSEVKSSDIKQIANKASKKKKESKWAWPVKILVIALFLSLGISVASEFALSNAGIAVSAVIILLLWVFGVVSDMIGVAAASASIEPFNAMSSRKVRGAKEGRMLVKNAEKVSSICNDVVGDICGIISGAAGSVISVKIITESMGNSVQILIAASVSAVIAGLTIFGKAAMKKVAMDNSTKVILTVGKILSIFTRNNKK